MCGLGGKHRGWGLTVNSPKKACIFYSPPAEEWEDLGERKGEGEGRQEQGQRQCGLPQNWYKSLTPPP